MNIKYYIFLSTTQLTFMDYSQSTLVTNLSMNFKTNKTQKIKNGTKIDKKSIWECFDENETSLKSEKEDNKSFKKPN